LQKTVESGCALGFGENFKPCRRKEINGGQREMKRKSYITLLDGTQFFLEIDVERGNCHLFLLQQAIEHPKTRMR
jgi:hypothetical protein